MPAAPASGTLISLNREFNFNCRTIKWNCRARSFYRDAASLPGYDRTKALGKYLMQRPRLWRCDPQPQQMSFTLRLGKILERGSIVKYCVVVNKLNIAGFELHHQVQ